MTMTTDEAGTHVVLYVDSLNDCLDNTNCRLQKHTQVTCLL